MVRSKSRSVAKQQSIDRIFKEYQDISIDDITQVQAAYYAKNPEKIKKILGKTKLADNTAMGYGRWANQYINHLTDVRQKEINVGKKRSVNLSLNFSDNLKKMGNKTDFKIDKSTKKEVLKDHKLIRLSSKFEDNANKSHELFLQNNSIVFKKYRIKLEINTDKGVGFVQSFAFSLSDYNKFEYLIKRIKRHIKENLFYSTHDKNIKDSIISSIGNIILEVER